MAAFYLPRWQLGMIVPPSSGKAGYLQQGGIGRRRLFNLVILCYL
ncbi:MULTISPECIES: hypothetical protein [unclassified Agarivorans]